ncbi:MAG: hypothetical protein HQ575_00580 [Candidatus Omnitrophica bacterium]|nr:hypothetical protein [Candidatus Omnitrophota bacterium]
MKLLPNLFILLGLALIIIGVITRFLGVIVIFPDVKPIAHVVFANTCFLIALILKLAKD